MSNFSKLRDFIDRCDQTISGVYLTEFDMLEEELRRACDAAARHQLLHGEELTRRQELERALRDIEVYYANRYVEGEINYQAVVVARAALGKPTPSEVAVWPKR